MFLLLVLILVEKCGVSQVIWLPTGFLWAMNDGEVPVVWIVEVARVVDVHLGLVGRSRRGDVGWVK